MASADLFAEVIALVMSGSLCALQQAGVTVPTNKRERNMTDQFGFKNLITNLIETNPRWMLHLEEIYKIDITPSTCGTLVSLKYNQRDSPLSEAIVQQCRGMVVDIVNGTVLAWPYNKFWNHGEPLANPINWETATVQEKLDGSLMILYWNPELEKWLVASSGNPTASGNFGTDSSNTFNSEFWDTWGSLGMKFPSIADSPACFMFEFCAQENKIVVQHDKRRIVLHGARYLDGREMLHSELEKIAFLHNWECVRTYPINDIDEAISASEALNAVETEGFIVVDGNHNRVKIKSPRYVLLHHMKGEATVRRAIELWKTGDAEELLTYFPEMAPVIVATHMRILMAVEAAADAVNKWESLSQKDFAMKIKKEPWSLLAFQLRREGKGIELATSISRQLRTSALEKLIEWNWDHLL